MGLGLYGSFLSQAQDETEGEIENFKELSNFNFSKCLRLDLNTHHNFPTLNNF